MTIQNRTVTIKGVFGKNAATTIPDPPASGASYRDTSVSKQAIEKGWAYKGIVDSAQFNEALFEYAYMTEQIEKYGFLPWCNLTNYPKGALCLGSDGVIYQAVKNTGPSTTAYDPVNDTSHTYWVDFVGYTYVTRNTSQTINGSKIFNGPNTFNGAFTLNGTFIAGETAKVTIDGFGMPNYTAEISVSDGYQTPANGFLHVKAGGNYRTSWVNINNTQVFESSWNASYGCPDNSFLAVSKGSTVNIMGVTVKFYPCLGG